MSPLSYFWIILKAFLLSTGGFGPLPSVHQDLVPLGYAQERNLTEALALAIELEELCEQYWRACQLGHPILLTAEEMRAVQEKFAGYGQQ